MTAAPADSATHDTPPTPGASTRAVALLGNPNVGKTTLFNRVARLRRKASNFPGTTQEAHTGFVPDTDIELIDLPGTYALDLDQPEAQACRDVLRGERGPKGRESARPDAIVAVADDRTIARTLRLLAEAAAIGRPLALVINTRVRASDDIDTAVLESELGIPVFALDARSARAARPLLAAVNRATTAPDLASIAGDDTWAERLAARAQANIALGRDSDSVTDRLDLAFTHPFLGVASFAVLMTALFWAVFELATIPMDWIDAAFASLASWTSATLPPGILTDLLSDGVIAGVGATLIFLPQIVLLFFLLELLDATGYLARASFVVDRALRPFGLSGHAFVPLLSSHACALPGIMATRTIRDPRERLAAILVAPFMSCTARIPVYVLLVSVLFPEREWLQAIAFTSCYALGIAAALVSSLLARRTLFKGRAAAMALELPSYARPNLALAARVAADRGLAFLRKAGTVILAISIVLWWLGEFPRHADPGAAPDQIAQHTFLGRLGGSLRPVFSPMGADEQLTVGILASFAAREVFVSAVSVQVGVDEDAPEGSFLDAMASADRADGSALFDTPTSAALLVYFVLAMQCLPTLAVTARESGSVRIRGCRTSSDLGVGPWPSRQTTPMPTWSTRPEPCRACSRPAARPCGT